MVSQWYCESWEVFITVWGTHHVRSVSRFSLHYLEEVVGHDWPLLINIPGVITNWFPYLDRQILLAFLERGATFQFKIQSLVQSQQRIRIKKLFIVQHPRATSDDSVIRISEGQPCPTSSALYLLARCKNEESCGGECTWLGRFF